MTQRVSELSAKVEELEQRNISPPTSGSKEDPFVIPDDEEEEVNLEWSRSPSPLRVLIPVPEPDQSIDAMEERFFQHAGIVWRWDGAIGEEVVPSLELGEEELMDRIVQGALGEDIIRDFAAEEAEQRERDAQEEEVPLEHLIERAHEDPAPEYTPAPGYDK